MAVATPKAGDYGLNCYRVEGTGALVVTGLSLNDAADFTELGPAIAVAGHRCACSRDSPSWPQAGQCY
jgi:hypothetical protein